MTDPTRNLPSLVDAADTHTHLRHALAHTEAAEAAIARRRDATDLLKVANLRLRLADLSTRESVAVTRDQILLAHAVTADEAAQGVAEDAEAFTAGVFDYTRTLGAVDQVLADIGMTEQQRHRIAAGIVNALRDITDTAYSSTDTVLSVVADALQSFGAQTGNVSYTETASRVLDAVDKVRSDTGEESSQRVEVIYLAMRQVIRDIQIDTRPHGPFPAAEQVRRLAEHVDRTLTVYVDEAAAPIIEEPEEIVATSTGGAA